MQQVPSQFVLQEIPDVDDKILQEINAEVLAMLNEVEDLNAGMAAAQDVVQSHSPVLARLEDHTTEMEQETNEVVQTLKHVAKVGAAHLLISSVCVHDDLVLFCSGSAVQS